MIELKEVSKTYQQGTRSIAVLKGLSVRIGKSEFVSVMGPSGSGKSTFLNLIGAMDVPTSGDIFFEGRSLTTLSDDELTLIRRRKIGFIFQFFNLLPLMTAAENVALPLFLEGKRFGEVRVHVEMLLEKVGLSHRSGHRPDQLSGGEMQRVAIARALAMSPPLLLGDEPTGNLDSRTGEEILNLLKTLHAEGQTIVMVTHDPKAATYGNRRITMGDGRLLEDIS